MLFLPVKPSEAKWGALPLLHAEEWNISIFFRSLRQGAGGPSDICHPEILPLTVCSVLAAQPAASVTDKWIQYFNISICSWG